MQWSVDGRVAIEVVDLQMVEAVEHWCKMLSWRYIRLAIYWLLLQSLQQLVH